MRTPEEFTAEMLKKKRHWSSILAVSAAIRGGRWRAQVKEILVNKKLIPTDHNEELKIRDDLIEKQRSDKSEKEKMERASRRPGAKNK